MCRCPHYGIEERRQAMNILISFIILIVAANLYILIRNEKVFVFRTYILDRAHNELLRILYEDIDKYESMHKEWNKIYDRHSYNKMLLTKCFLALSL